MSAAGGVTTWIDPASGRTHVIIKESRPFNLFASKSSDASRVSTFAELVKVPLDGVSRGQLAIGSSISPPAGFAGTTLLMEINVIGYMGALRTIVDRGVLSATAPSRRFHFDDVDTYTALGIEVRQVIDGAPNNTVTPAQFSLQGTGLFWS
jgi:hypothetical protein